VEYTPEAAKWFDAFTLANNHTDNMEEVDGLDQTRQNLQKKGFNILDILIMLLNPTFAKLLVFP
jgi:hypothetical protein